jgi:hypothetical protein
MRVRRRAQVELAVVLAGALQIQARVLQPRVIGRLLQQRLDDAEFDRAGDGQGSPW